MTNKTSVSRKISRNFYKLFMINTIFSIQQLSKSDANPKLERSVSTFENKIQKNSEKVRMMPRSTTNLTVKNSQAANKNFKKSTEKLPKPRPVWK